MPEPIFEIYQNKPYGNAQAQYIQVTGVEDYWNVGFDTDFIGDDIYTIVEDIGRGPLQSNEYFTNFNWPNSVRGKNPAVEEYYDGVEQEGMGDYIFGAGRFRISRINVETNTSSTNHYDDTFSVYFVDSAAFQPGQGFTGDGPNNTIPEDWIWSDAEGNTKLKPNTDDHVIVNAFMHDSKAFCNGRRIYHVTAAPMSDCKVGKKDEFDPESTIQLVGDAIVDQNENAALTYYPCKTDCTDSCSTYSPPSANSGIWNYKFFPVIYSDTIVEQYGYNNSNCAPANHSSGKPWAQMVYADRFTNKMAAFGGEIAPIDDYWWDYDTPHINENGFTTNTEGSAFYIVGYYTGKHCTNVYKDNDRKDSMAVYRIPKKWIFDHWNGDKRICIRFGSDFECASSDIEYKVDKPPQIDHNSPGSWIPWWKRGSARFYIEPPRYFYKEATVNGFNSYKGEYTNDESFSPNPIKFDSHHPYAGNWEETTIAGTGANPITSFYPYVSDIRGSEYLYNPMSHFNLWGNIEGVTDKTMYTSTGREFENSPRSYEHNYDSNISNYADDYLDRNILDGMITQQDITNKNFRPISYAWIGDTTDNTINNDNSLTVQRYYEDNSVEEAQTSAPNFVNVWVSIADLIDNGSDINHISYEDTEWVGPNGDVYKETGVGYKWCVARWGDEEGIEDESDDDLILQVNNFTSDANSFYVENYTNDHYVWENIKDRDGFGVKSHQYRSEGIYEIKAFVFSYLYNEDQDGIIAELYQKPTLSVNAFQTLHWKLMTIRINVNLSDAFIEDFSEIGGPSFKFIPMPSVAPVIGGLHPNSRYWKTLNKVVNDDLFHPNEIFDRARARKAVKNDMFGYWPGEMDLGQVRMFKKPYTITELLGIENDIMVTPTRLRKHDYREHWDGIEYSFSSKTSVGQLFIDDNVDLELKNDCIMEIQTDSLTGNKILDTSGHSNIGILIGDYSLKKRKANEPVVRTKTMKTPKISTKLEKGAI